MLLRLVKAFACIASVGYSTLCFSQGVEVAQSSFKTRQVIPPSPDAAALGKYGNTPVSLFSGTPNINVPIGDLKGNFLSMPVSLSYHASGFKPEEIAPWTGLGWTLNAGGVITRAVIGNPDTDDNYFISPSPIVAPMDNTMDRIRYLKNIYDGTIEAQPDVYYYNFMGRSGRFYLLPDKTIFKKEADMLSIKFTAGKFVIKDENGYTYNFDYQEVTNTIPNDEVGSPSYHWYNYTSSWYLGSVISVNGNERLNFSYYSPTAKQSVYDNALKNQSAIYSYKTSACSAVNPQRSNENSYSTPPTTQVTRTFLQSVTLARSSPLTVLKIVEFGSVVDQRQDLWLADFAGERRLDTIKMYTFNNGVKTLTSSHRLFYSYFTADGTGLGDLRLRLDSIKELSIAVGTADKPAYKFSYDNTPLPNRYTSNIDHWGYYNYNGNNSLIPTVIRQIDGVERPYGLNAKRESDFGRSKAGILLKMVYPTGGFTEFIYGAHSKEVGGVRINAIYDYSFANTIIKRKHFIYESPLGGKKPVYDKITQRTDHGDGCQSVCNSTMPMWCLDSYTTTLTISTNSIYGLGSVAGSPIGYERVSEVTYDGGNRQLGKTIYTYKDAIASQFDESIAAGTLIKQETYDITGKLLQESSFDYTFNISTSISGAEIKPENFQTNENIACRQSTGIIYVRSTTGQNCLETESVPVKFNLQTYSISNQRKLLIKQTDKQFDQATGNYLVTTKDFFYGTTHNSPIRIEQTNSTTNEEVVTLMQYASDYTYSGTLAGPAVNHNAAVVNNIKSLEVEKVQYRQNPDGSNKRYLNGTLTTYTAHGLPEKIYRLELSSPLTSFATSTISGGSLTYHTSYKPLGEYIYSSLNNLIEQRKTGDMPTSYVWDYNSLQPVASITNAPNTEISYTGFETSEGGGWVLTSITYNSTLALTGSRSCNMTTGSQIARFFTPATTSKYLLSYWTRGAALTVTVNSASVAASPQGLAVNGWYYYEHVLPIGATGVTVNSSSATVDDIKVAPKEALTTTYTYLPDIGVSSQVDPNNMISRFEYDGLKRLTNVKDRDGNIIKNYKYNYGLGSAVVIPKKLFYNEYAELSKTKQGCPVNTYPTTEIYSVPEGRYAALDQTTANNMAAADLTANAQNYANQVGICNYHSIQMGTTATKNNCEPWQGPGFSIRYTLPAGSYKSPVSQAAADQLAADNLQARAQAEANAIAGCTCYAPDKRYINGVCETGTRINSGWTYEGSQGYLCYYFYLFSDSSQSQLYSEYVSTAGQCTSL